MFNKNHLKASFDERRFFWKEFDDEWLFSGDGEETDGDSKRNDRMRNWMQQENIEGNQTTYHQLFWDSKLKIDRSDEKRFLDTYFQPLWVQESGLFF